MFTSGLHKVLGWILATISLPEGLYFHRFLNTRNKYVIKIDEGNLSVVEKNVTGRYYVDESCIYCEYCVENAAGNFTHDPHNRFAYVSKQPENKAERKQIEKSMKGCPTKSIHDDHKPKTGWRVRLGLDESATPSSIAGSVMQIITGWFRKNRKNK